MQIALIGYGKMGRAINALGSDQGHQFPLIVDLDNRPDLNGVNLESVDVAIEFTTPDSAPENIMICIENGVPVVTGTTGWNTRVKEIELLCKKKQGCMFRASNFSIGVNILFALNTRLAKIMDKFTSYKASIEEVHHSHKLDTPSGTAISLAEQIIEQQRRVKSWSTDEEDHPFTLKIVSRREGEVTGLHEVTYESDLDSISLKHDAKSRDAFAAGALLAAEFVRGKTGIFSMKDLLKF